ncbi:MAG: diaminopimelate epimerase [Actinobacteria bacterium]|nr:diaminopimelate epimerase [Thermoleophilia bacterium]MCB9010917.1 diaminopimelate epimerase [Actinomycetota bacterium]
MRFEKWHGTGNHHVVVDVDALPAAMSPARARLLCDPFTGIGADGVLVVSVDDGHPRMTVWNADGSVAENCGNGIRIVAAHLHRDGRLPEDGAVLTGQERTVVTVLDDGAVRVRMGRARFPAGDGLEALTTSTGDVVFTEVSMGNPHAVVLHQDPVHAVTDLGPEMEVAPRFPHRTNAEFVRVEDDHRLLVRVWERGVGATMACGTGACAAAAVAVSTGAVETPVEVSLAGGTLVIDVDDDLEITMTGPAEHLYTATLAHPLLERFMAAGESAV